MLKFIWLGATALCLGSCASSTSHNLDATVPASFANAYADSTRKPGGNEAAWWLEFHDTTLDSLISDALENSHDLKAWKANLVAARAMHESVRARLFPELTVSGTSYRSDPGYTSQNRSVSVLQSEFDTGFDADIFGGNKARSRATSELENAAAADVSRVRLSLIAEVAATYVSLREVESRQTWAVETQRVARQISERRQQQADAGLISRGDAYLAHEQMDLADEAVTRWADAHTQLIYALSALTGDDKLALANNWQVTGEIPVCQLNSAIAAPIEIIRRRPDVAVSERNLLAATSLHKAAIADLFPHITIGGYAGRQDTSILPSHDVYSGAVGFSLPFFNFGRLQSEIKVSDARESEAYEGYRQTVLAAVIDVETKLRAVQESNTRLKAALDGTPLEQKRLEDAKAQQAAGLISSMALDVETLHALEAADHLSATRSDYALRFIALEKALAN